MGGAYSESNVHVRSFDDVLQSMHQDKVEADTARKYWGKPHEIVFKQKLTGTPIICEAIPYSVLSVFLLGRSKNKLGLPL